MGPRRQSRSALIDSLAIGLSSMCLVHCLATAVAVALLASAAGPLLDPRIHEIGLAVAILLAAAALGYGLSVHRQWWPVLVGSGGLAAMSAGLIVPHGPLELVLTMFGVALLATAHFGNRRACR